MNFFVELASNNICDLVDDDMFANPINRRVSGLEDFGPFCNNAFFLLPDPSPVNYSND
jgi:hypothetical protein